MPAFVSAIASKLALTGFWRSRQVGCALAWLIIWAVGLPGVGLSQGYITMQPHSVTAPLGGTAVFSVNTETMMYIFHNFQWRHNGLPIPGATLATLTITNVQLGDAGSYDVIVGTQHMFLYHIPPPYTYESSTTVTLSIGQPIQFAVLPHDASVAVGSSAVFHVEVTGDGPFAYQWLMYPGRTIADPWWPPSKIVDDANYHGATTPTLVANTPPFTDGCTQLICEVTDAHGSPVNSAIAQLFTSNLECLSVTTLAGGGEGKADGIGNAARFYHPSGIAADADGNLYVADSGNHAIRKITPTGVVSTLAGLAGAWGSVDGIGTAARFYYPSGIAVDTVGNLYVADSYNNTIRKITAAGVVTTLAGLAGIDGNVDGTGNVARFNDPTGIAVDAVGNLYVADEWNSAIRKITPAGVVTTFAGLSGTWGNVDDTGSAARFSSPAGIAVDAVGNLYVADSGNATIRKITPAGVVTTLAGLAGTRGSIDGTGTAARFSNPFGIAVDAAGNLYVADYRNETIRKITPAGLVTTLAGQVGTWGSVDGTGSRAQFNGPTGIAVDAAGSIFIADTGNNVIRKGVPITLEARLGSLSARGLAGSGDRTLIVGLATSGSGTKQLLLRGAGPGLSSYGISGFLADPALTLFNSAGCPLQQNDNWGGTATLMNASAQVGAFPLSPNSKDAALLASLPGGIYSAHLTTTGATGGVALLEAYDADPGTPTTRLASLSVRNLAGTGDNALIAGFAITGNVSRTVLIRGIGPTLTRYGVTGVLANPQLQVFQGDTLLAQNDDWGGDTSLASVSAQVGAFALDATSKDAALLLTLPPGAYTAQVSVEGNTTGIALVEVYEVP
jgi:sugar lactone lactonase YvrE